MRTSLLFFLTTFLLLSSNIVSAQIGNLGGFDLQNTAKLILGYDVNPKDLAFPNFIYFIVFPFIAIVTVLYGVMTEIRIFRSTTVKTILSITMAGMTLPTGIMLTTVYYLYSIGAWVAVAGFGVVFILGTILWGVGRVGGLAYNISDTKREISTINQQLKQLDQSLKDGKIKQEDYLDQQSKLRIKKRRMIQSLGLVEELGESN